MQKQFTHIQWRPTHLFQWAGECVYLLFMRLLRMIYVRLYLSTGDTLKEAERQHHFTCVWLKVFAVFWASS